jgi:hypothetical protein
MPPISIVSPKLVANASLAATLCTTALARPIPLEDEWTFFNPEGISTIANQSFSITEVFEGETGNIVRWEAVADAKYSLWTTTDLNTWSEATPSILATSEVGEFTDMRSPAAERRYYQVRWDPDNQ